MKSRSSRLLDVWDAGALAIVLGFAACVIAVNVGPHRIGGLDAETDFYGGYAPAASELAHGHMLSREGQLPAVYGFVGPLYPLALALLTPVAGGAFRAALALSLAAAVGTLLAWQSLLRRIAGPLAGLAAVLLLATNAVFFRQAYWVTTDALAVALQSLAVWTFMREPPRARMALAAGFAAGLAFLTRYTSAWLLPAGIVALGFVAPVMPGRAAWRPRMQLWGAYAGGFTLLALPWVVFARLHGGAVQFHQLLAFDLYATRDGMSWDDFLARVWPRFMNDPWLVYRSDPAGLLKHLAGNLVTHLAEDVHRLLGVPLVLASGAGLLISGLRRQRAALLLAQAGAWSYLALVPAGYNERYALAVLPGYVALAALAFAAPLGAGAHADPRAGPRAGRNAARNMNILRAVRALLLLGVAVSSARASIRLQGAVLEQQPLEALACAHTLRALARPGDRVIARKPHVGWLAGVGTEPYPASDDLAGLADAARRSGARWLYLSASEALLRPRTAFLLDTTAVVPGLARRALSFVPMRMQDGFEWPRLGILYEIGPGFGHEPDGFEYARVRTLHLLRGSALPVPNAATWLRLASAELAFGDTARARGAWGTVVRIDPAGAATFLAGAGGDTLRALATAR